MTEQVERADPSVRLEATITGEINGSRLVVKGNGYLFEEEGLSEVVLSVHEAPDGLDGQHLAPVLFTGYPNSCVALGGHFMNPFQGVDYEYHRTYRHSQGYLQPLELAMCYRRLGEGRALAAFHVNGDLPISLKVAGVSPITETWTCAGPRQLRGSFEVAWLDHDGCSLGRSRAWSSYSVLPMSHHSARRYIDLKVSGQETEYKVVQHSYILAPAI